MDTNRSRGLTQVFQLQALKFKTFKFSQIVIFYDLTQMSMFGNILQPGIESIKCSKMFNICTQGICIAAYDP